MAVGSESNTTSENPVPSITLSITQDDVKRVLDASKAMAESLAVIQKECEEKHTAPMNDNDNDKADHSSTPIRAVSHSEESESSDAENSKPSSTSQAASKPTGKRPLHQMIFEAAQQCEHPMLTTFLEKMKASGSTNKEIRAGILVFYDLDLKSKIKILFDVLGEKKDESSDTTLSREGALSLFRSVIVAISSCIHKEKKIEIEMEKDSVSEPPIKKRKVEENNSPESEKPNTPEHNAGNDSVPALQSPSPSFDHSLATLKDEDDFTTSVVRKEFEEIATYATDRLVRYYQNHGGSADRVAVSGVTFEEWRKAEGGRIAPWLDLLGFEKWKPPPRKANANSANANNNSTNSNNGNSSTTISEKAAKVEVSKIEASKIEPTKVKAEPATEKVSPPKVKEEPKSSPERKPAHATPPKETTPPVKKQSPERPKESPTYHDDETSRTVVSFDFTGSGPTDNPDTSFCINITEENLSTLRNLVRTTGLAHRPPCDITDIILGASKHLERDQEDMRVIPIERFHTCLHQLLGSGSQKRLSKMDKDVFSSCFVDFFSCFDKRTPPFDQGEVDAKELAVGFCFLCAGNKSAKLSAGYELLESEPSLGLTTDQLTQYLRSYLTMLCGISLLTSSSEGIMKPKLNNTRRKAMFNSVENGARWTLSHFLKTTGRSANDVHSFDAFAQWYTDGGFNVAPWLELLDLHKLLSLVGDASDIAPQSPPCTRDALPPFPGPTPKQQTPTPTFESPHAARLPAHSDAFTHPPAHPPAEVLFTFPLANQRSLVVLREDATYVQGVVDQLRLLPFNPDEVWSTLYSIASKRPVPPHRGAKSTSKNGQGKAIPVNKATFVECMQETIQIKTNSRKRSASGTPKSFAGTRDVLSNLFHSFDLLQVDRVALNELMGGLTLLCGGKKSTKLAFAFGVFDQRPPPKSKRSKKTHVNSLGGEDLFLFLRSFLIVMFSACRQSWDLSDDCVNRYIADTANMVTEDVMRYQWRTRKRDRVDFDEFGQWYNEGGFETAPWLELLDLKKWVLVENFDNLDTHRPQPPPQSPALSLAHSANGDCPPPPPDHEVDASFFDDDDEDHPTLMPMDSIDEMDILLMEQSHDKENEAELNKLARTFSYSPKTKAPPPRSSTSLKFHLVTEDDHGGYVISVSQKRIQHLRQILIESGLSRLEGEIACKQILGKSFRDEKTGRYCLNKDDFDSAMRGVVASRNMSMGTQRTLSDILSEMFEAFDYSGTGRVNAVEVACGFTVLCKGKKSDKLEYAFEVLDRERRGNLSQSDTAKYLRSFLTVLLNIVSTKYLDSDEYEDTMTTTSGMRCERTTSIMARAVEAGSSWASAQAFRNGRKSRDLICFDEFAEWYTQVGFSNIPWLELLDLQKWVITEP